MLRVKLGLREGIGLKPEVGGKPGPARKKNNHPGAPIWAKGQVLPRAPE